MKDGFVRAERIPIRKTYSEKWLQDRIEEDTSLLGLGDINIVERERKQSSGGRIDFLFYDPEIETMYETEIMLGQTDESHIIRTIEYWDIERRRYPNKDHRAVIVAEEITNRFFNVISLMNKSIPIIAIQVECYRVGDQITLIFTKVLDTYEAPEDETDLGGASVDRSYWEKNSNPKSIKIFDQISGHLQSLDENIRITYNKAHIAVGTQRKNFAWFHPRKKAGRCHFNIRVGVDNVEKVKEVLEELGVPFSARDKDYLGVPLQANVFQRNQQEVLHIFERAREYFS